MTQSQQAEQLNIEITVVMAVSQRWQTDRWVWLLDTL